MPRARQSVLRWTAAVACCAVVAAGGWYVSTHARPATPRPVTFTRDVAPIVFAKCAGCHHPGEAAPFSLLAYDDVHRRAGQIVEVTHSRFMPPWLPAAGHGEFVGERRLTDDELETFRRWA